MAPQSDAYRFCPRCGGPLASRLVKPGEPARLVCEVCGFVLYLNPKVAAGAITTIDGEIVLLRRAIEPERGKWVFPGGFVDRGETPADAAVRETLEEVNLAVELDGLLGVYAYPGNEVVVVAYSARVVGGQLCARDECLEVRTFAPAAIPWDELAFRTTRDAIAEYVQRIPPESPQL
jgi:ADP-ribose pyrophosphatase YjhB (NUDIX family)